MAMKHHLSLCVCLSAGLLTLATPQVFAAPGDTTQLVESLGWHARDVSADGRFVSFSPDTGPAEAYAVDIEHAVLSEERIGHEGRRLELRLLLKSEDARDLYDLRVWLVGAGESSWLRNCKSTPARLRVLPSATQKEITASFACLEGRPSKDSSLREMQFRIEAVDLSTQAIVNFAASSHEGN
jgi:hypothetical protein